MPEAPLTRPSPGRPEDHRSGQSGGFVPLSGQRDQTLSGGGVTGTAARPPAPVRETAPAGNGDQRPNGRVPTPGGDQEPDPAPSGPGDPRSDREAWPGPEPEPEPEPEHVEPNVLDTWRDTLQAARLADTLLVSGDIGTGALDLTNAHPSGLATLLAGVPTRLSSLVREPAALATARHRVRAVRAAVGTLRLERGMHAGYLAVGVASWRPGLSGPLPGRDEIDLDDIRAPILLRGCTLRPRGASHDDYDLDLDGTVGVNSQLLRRLQSDYGVALDGVALAGMAFGPDGFDPAPVFHRLGVVCSRVPGFRIERSLLVGTFSAGSADLRADLDDAQKAIEGHRLLGRAVCGERSRRRRQAGAPELADGAEPADGVTGAVGAAGAASRPSWPADCVAAFDEASPDPVLDLDPAQRAALVAAVSGADVALEGPPGSGLTQTTAAILAAIASAGRTALVVTPQRGTAEALVARLAAAGAADAVLDLHDAAGDRAAILAGFAAGLAAADARASVTQTRGAGAGEVLDGAGSGVQAGEPEDAGQRFRTARDGLRAASDALHERRDPWGVSAYEAMVALSALVTGPHPPCTRVRLPIDVTRHLDTSTRERLRDDLREAAALGAFTMTRLDTRWLDARVHSTQEAVAALAAAGRARDALPKAHAAMEAVAQAAGMAAAGCAGQWREQLELLIGVRDTLDLLQPAVFEQPIPELVAATSPHGRPTGFDGRPLGLRERRQLRRRARSLIRPGVHVPDLHQVLAEAMEQRGRWQAAGGSGGWPRVPTGLADAVAAVQALDSALAVVCACLEDTGTPDLLALPVEKLARRLADLACDGEGLRDQPRRTVLLDRLRGAGLGDLIADLQVRRVGPDDVDGELDLAWWTSVLEAVIRSDQRLARHDPDALRGWMADLRDSDAGLTVAARSRLSARLAAGAAAAVAAHPAQARWLRTEVVRGHRTVWPADLFSRARAVVAAIRPIWVMSPDAVARLLPPAVPGEPLVDVVVVDDAGQVGMPEAAAALARGRSVVAAGDRRRLPPATGGPSVLDVVASLAGVHRLDRGHRARDARLVEPLLGLYPQGWSVAPGAAAASPLALEYVEDGTAVPAPGEDMPVSPDAEVARVVRLVGEHARRRPGESLLVVTLGGRHAERIEGALRTAVATDLVLAAWLDVHWTGGIDEPFLVRPVHRLAGLERDAAIVSVGFGRTPHGRVVHRFGVLDGRFGQACLLAALSRSRRRTTLVCSFTVADLAVDRVRTPGARLLRDALAHLDPAATSAACAEDPAFRRDLASQRTPDALVADLARRLCETGMQVSSWVPAPDRPLDLAVGDPLEPGRQLLAVELDGPGHAECPSVRLRDRQRPQSFERAGWTYLRVAAMDLFCDPDGEVERIHDAWRAAGGLPRSVVPARVLPPPPSVRSVWPAQVATGLPFSAYGQADLEAVARWAVSDGATRTLEQVAAEIRTALGLVHREPQVDAAVNAAAGRALEHATVRAR